MNYPEFLKATGSPDAPAVIRDKECPSSLQKKDSRLFSGHPYGRFSGSLTL
ncbi:hypothetical protein [Paenibacillus sp. 1P03SA]|uniref:hypothetical protein n=1 Tax=Paenibacillus sp. 1P03SA TaxID=3132294 RepID=UPI00399F63A6